MFAYYMTLHDQFPRLLGQALARTIRTLEPTPLAHPRQRLLRNHMPAWHHHGRILIRRLLLTDRTHKDGVEMERARQGDLNGEFLRGGPLGALVLHDVLQLQQGGQGDGARGGGNVEGGFSGEAEQGTEFADEGS